MGGPRSKVKSFEIDKRLVQGAWERVRANQGAPGVDAVSITEFADNASSNLFKLWNRMSSGSYLPGSVRGGDTEGSRGGSQDPGRASSGRSGGPDRSRQIAGGEA
jgi:RNA-directed DNA polymerase